MTAFVDAKGAPMTDAEADARTKLEPRPARERIMRYFKYAHLPIAMQEVSRPFGELAERMHDKLPAGPERSVALRKLLESKDAAVRASLPEEQA